MKKKYLFGLMLLPSCFITVTNKANALMNLHLKRALLQAFYGGDPVNKNLEAVKSMHKNQNSNIDKGHGSGIIKRPVPVSNLIFDTTNNGMDFESFSHAHGNGVFTSINPLKEQKIIELSYNTKTGVQGTSVIVKTNPNQSRQSVIVNNPNGPKVDPRVALPELNNNPFNPRPSN